MGRICGVEEPAPGRMDGALAGSRYATSAKCRHIGSIAGGKRMI
jgi:hypothetical protein